jgi:hypothetical protein
MNASEVEKFEKAQLQLEGLYKEVKILSSKRPDDAINKFKLRLINQLLENANGILQKKNLPFKDFLIFDEDEIPTNSDVIFILSGYLSAFEKVRSENIEETFGEWYWKVDGKGTKIKTARPKKLVK